MAPSDRLTRDTLEALHAASGHARRAATAARELAQHWRDLAAAYRLLRDRWREDHGQA